MHAGREEKHGLWADGDSRIDRWHHRYGVFRLEPGLLWSDNEPNNDPQGGYLRSDMSTLRYDITVGLDLTQTDIDNREDRAGNNLYNGFRLAARPAGKRRYVWPDAITG